MKNVPREEKPAVGQLLNEARKAITKPWTPSWRKSGPGGQGRRGRVDLTLPAAPCRLAGCTPHHRAG
ncbi:MAG: hypothetical protein ACLRPT_04870 [Akkermansia muciniphila]